MPSWWEALKQVAAPLTGAAENFSLEFVGEMLKPKLQMYTEGWSEQGVLNAIRTGQHYWPLYPPEARAKLIAEAKPHKEFAKKVSKEILATWFRAARPQLYHLIITQPGGWPWLCDEMNLFLADVTRD